MTRATLLFLKHPLPGRVKTRLAAAVGDDAAAALYRAFTEVLVRELRELDPILWCDPPEALAECAAWLGPGRYRSQTGGDLGERMRAALQEALDEGARTAVLLGSDSPQLTAAEVRRAHEALERAQVVLGPARDGGYYLVGVRDSVPDLFRGIPWSTPGVLDATLRRAGGLEIALLEEAFDVDEAADLADLLALVPQRPHLRPLLPLLQAATSRSPSREPA